MAERVKNFTIKRKQDFLYLFRARIDQIVCHQFVFYVVINLHGMRTLKRSPTPKLGDLRPKVLGNVCVNSLCSCLCPEMDLNRWSFANECVAFDGEKFTASCVVRRHLC